MKNIGVIGFGGFGKFFVSHLKENLGKDSDALFKAIQENPYAKDIRDIFLLELTDIMKGL